MAPESPDHRLQDLFDAFEDAGVPSVRADLDLGRLGTKGNPSQTNAAVVWLKNKSESQQQEDKRFRRRQTRRWLFTSFIAFLALILGAFSFILAAGQP